MLINTDKNLAPDYAHWLLFETWSLDDAIYLLLNIEPEKQEQVKDNEELNNAFSLLEKYALDAQGISLTFIKHPRYVFIAPHPEMDELVDYGRVQPKIFIKWARVKKFEIPEPLQILLSEIDDINENTEIPNQNDIHNKVTQRVSLILKLAEIWFKDLMKVPTGGKAKLKKTMLEVRPKLFSDSTFEKAWQQMKKEGLIQVQNVEQYKSGK